MSFRRFVISTIGGLLGVVFLITLVAAIGWASTQLNSNGGWS
jgi:hypothetical protein